MENDNNNIYTKIDIQNSVNTQEKINTIGDEENE